MCDCDVCSICQSCGTPWEVDDQEEWSKDQFLQDFHTPNNPETIRKVKAYWKKHVEEWIDDLGPSDTVPKSLDEIVDIMLETDMFYCEDCNSSCDGTRCQRNRMKCEKSATKKRGREEVEGVDAQSR